MSLQRRKKWTQTAAKIILALAVLDALVYVVADRPLGGLIANEQDRFTNIRLEWWRQRASLAGVERRKAALPAEQQQIQTFLDQHVPPRREAFSRAAALIEQLTQQSGVHLAAVKYSPAQSKGEPLDHLGLETEVQGPFPNLLSFAHELETANDFTIVRGFRFATRNGGVLALHVNADLYLMP